MFEVFSYAYRGLHPDVLKYQKMVFDKFNLPITQVIGDMSHGKFLENVLNTTDKKYVIFFDADCIPLSPKIYDIIISELQFEKCIIGIEQTGEPRYHIYAGPACLGLELNLYYKLGKPNLNQTFRSDIAEELTWNCEENGIKVKFFKVSNVEEKKWRLGYDREFGIGTTYTYNDEEVLYHQFESRLNCDNFIKKCISILDI